MGSVRRADFGSDFDGSGDTRAKRAHNFFAAVVFRWRCDFAGRGTPGRKQGIRNDEEISSRGGSGFGVGLAWRFWWVS